MKEDRTLRWPFELTGLGKVKRLRASFFYLSAVAIIIVLTAVHALKAGPMDDGGSLWFTTLVFVLTIIPILVFYPVARFLLGGRDSLLAVIISVVFSETVKHKSRKSIETRKSSR